MTSDPFLYRKKSHAHSRQRENNQVMAPNVSTSHHRLYTLEIPAGNDIVGGKGGEKLSLEIKISSEENNKFWRSDRQGLFTNDRMKFSREDEYKLHGMICDCPIVKSSFWIFGYWGGI